MQGSKQTKKSKKVHQENRSLQRLWFSLQLSYMVDRSVPLCTQSQRRGDDAGKEATLSVDNAKAEEMLQWGNSFSELQTLHMICSIQNKYFHSDKFQKNRIGNKNLFSNCEQESRLNPLHSIHIVRKT
jgi:hypothetical protein